MTANQNKPATGKEIASITGLEDDGFITVILSLGATAAEVTQAFEYFENEEKTISHSLGGNVQRIYEILEEHDELNNLSERL